MTLTQFTWMFNLCRQLRNNGRHELARQWLIDAEEKWHAENGTYCPYDVMETE